MLGGASEPDARQRGIVAAIIGAKAKLDHTVDHKVEKAAAEKKKNTTITAGAFDHQVSRKMGSFFDATFLPVIKKLIEDGLSYDEVKRRVNIPAKRGVKVTADQFEERVGNR
jgi:hypothetical protein